MTKNDEKYDEREIGVADVELVCNHRERMFLEAGHAPDTLKLMTENFRPWLLEQIESGGYFGRVVEIEGAAIASIGLMVMTWPPHPLHPVQSKRGYVLNLFVEPLHRRRGIASRLMGYANGRFSALGVEYRILHSTKVARGMYEGLGWKGTSEMAFVSPACHE